MRVALIAVLGLGLGACGDDGVTINSNDDNFCEQISEVVCHNLYNCCTEEEIQGYLDVSEPRTELQCREDVKRSCDRRAPDVRDSLAAGRIVFDAARLNACLTALLAPDGVCAEVVQGSDLPWQEACEEAPWVGTVPTDGACFFNFDCQGSPDSFCGPDQKCKAKPTAGFPCGAGCASDFYCATNGTCAAKVAVGGPCTSNIACAEDLYCDQTTNPQMPVCAMKGGGGMTCTTSAACLSSTCVPGVCANSTQSCYSDAGCLSRCAGTGFSCDEAGDCAAGNCSVTGVSCFDPGDCTGVNDNCVFPVQCVPGDCIGEPVCTSQTLVADYCTNVGVVPSP